MMSSYEDAVAMIDGVTRDVAKWYLENDPGFKFRWGDKTVEEDDIDDWIYEVRLTATANHWRELCEKYWAWYLGYEYRPRSSHH